MPFIKFLHRGLANLKQCTLYSLVKIFFQYYLLALVQVRVIKMNAGLALLTSFETAYYKTELVMFKASSQKARTSLT